MGIGLNDDCTRLAVPLLAPVLRVKPITSSHRFGPSFRAVKGRRIHFGAAANRGSNPLRLLLACSLRPFNLPQEYCSHQWGVF